MSHLENATELAEHQEHVAGRRQLYAAGIPRWFVRNELKQRRWQLGGQQTIVLHNGPVGDRSRHWIAVLEVGGRAALDGVTALQWAGAKGVQEDLIHVSTPKSSTPRKPPGVRVHETRRYRAEDVIAAGIPRMRAATAAVHAALWARSDRQAKLFLVVAVQQRLAHIQDIASVLGRVKRHPRRRVLLECLADLLAGSESLNEIDVALAMRERGLPEPNRQAVRRRPDGTTYVDAEYDDYDLVLEIDGIQHEQALAKLNDLLRDLAEIRDGRRVIRVSVLAWALDKEAVLDALEEVFRSQGWSPELAA